jgi:hypothetical protein
MPDRVVLADLAIDSTGVVTGATQASRAMRDVETTTERTAKGVRNSAGAFDLLSARMFNMKTAAAALLGGATLGGVIVAISNLTSEVVTNTAAWKEWTRSFDDALRKITQGETQFTSAARHIAEAMKSTGVSTIFGTPGSISNIAGAAVELDRRKRELQAQSNQRLGFGAMMLGPFGAAFSGEKQGVGAAAALEMQVIDRELETLYDQLFKIQQQTGLTDKEFDLLFGTHLSTYVKKAQKVLEEFTDSLREPVRVIQRAIGMDEASLFDNGPPLREPLLTGGWPWTQAEPPGGAVGFGEPGEGTSEFTLGVDDATKAMDALNEQLQLSIERYDMIGTVAAAASQAIVAAADAGLISQKAATKAFMLLNAVQSIQAGLIEKAHAAAAFAAGHYAKAALHWIAAGLYFAAAEFNGQAAFGGGGGGGGAADRGAADTGLDDTRGERVQRITIINQGVMVNDPDSFVRWITDKQRRSGDR